MILAKGSELSSKVIQSRRIWHQFHRFDLARAGASCAMSSRFPGRDSEPAGGILISTAIIRNEYSRISSSRTLHCQPKFPQFAIDPRCCVSLLFQCLLGNCLNVFIQANLNGRGHELVEMMANLCRCFRGVLVIRRQGIK